MQLQEWNKIHELKLGASIYFDGVSILKVPNGWIVTQHFGPNTTSTFVPDVIMTRETNHQPI